MAHREPSSPPWETRLDRLKAQFEEGGGSMNGLNVYFRWWTPAMTYVPALEPVTARRPSFRIEDRPRRVALFGEPARKGDQAFLVFDVSPGDLPSRDGVGKGVVFGETVPGGVLCLVTERATMWPINVPQRPNWRTPRL